MKHIIPFVIILIVSACQNSGELFTYKNEETTVKISMNLDTKAQTEVLPAEEEIEEISLVVYDSEGNLQCVKRLTSLDPCEVLLPHGEMSVYAFVNCDLSHEFLNVDTIEHLSSYAEGNTIAVMKDGLFQMRGKTDCVVAGSTTEISVNIERYISRFNIISFENKLSTPAIVKSVYLTNVQGAFNFFDNVNTSVWHNKFGRPETDQSESARITSSTDVVLGDKYFRALAVTLPAGNKININNCFLYALPNYYTGEDVNGWSESFTPRYTRLVFDVMIGGKQYYYPVNLVNMRNNTSYDIGLVLNRLGSADPDTFDYFVDDDVTIDFGDFEIDDDIIIHF